MENKINKLNESEKNGLLNILNVFTRISDKDFIENYWGDGDESNYNSLVDSCQEAFAILDDFSFFNLLTPDKRHWSSELVPLKVENLFITLAKKIDDFQRKDKHDYKVSQLLVDDDWLEIMKISKETAKELKKALNLKKNDVSYLI